MPASLAGSGEGFEAPGEGVEVLEAFPADRGDIARGFVAQRLATATETETVGDAALFRQNVEIPLLDMDLRANVRPAPGRRDVQARQRPSFDLLPSILGEKGAAVSKLGLELVQPRAPPLVSIAIDAKDEDVRHPSMLLDDLPSALRVQRLTNTAKQWILADPTRALALLMARKSRSNKGFNKY